MEWFLLWMFMVSTKIAAFMSMLGWFLVAAFLIHGLVRLIHGVDNPEAKWKALKKTVVFGIVLIALSSMIPSKKDIALIVAGGVGYNALTSEAAKEVGGKSLAILNKKLEAYLDEGSDQLVEAAKDATSKAVKETVTEITEKGATNASK